MRIFRFLFLAASVMAFAPGIHAKSAQDSLAILPQDRLGEAWWQKRWTEKKALAARGGWEVVLIGDSITQGWEAKGKAAWAKYLEPRKALALGYGGDRTEHVLWRLDNGEIDGLRPKAVVIMVGTNNTGHRKDPPDAIAAGVRAILDRVRKKAPEAKILLLAIFPRGANREDPLRVNNDAANQILKTFEDGRYVFFADIGERFLGPDGSLSKEVMPDLLHLNEASYDVWGAELERPLKEKLGL